MQCDYSPINEVYYFVLDVLWIIKGSQLLILHIYFVLLYVFVYSFVFNLLFKYAHKKPG